MGTTIQGETAKIMTEPSVTVNGANVVLPDVAADNGVVHVIDAVIVPPSIDVGAFLETCPEPEKPAPEKPAPEKPEPPAKDSEPQVEEPAEEPAMEEKEGSSDDASMDDSGAAVLSASAAMIGADLVTAFL